MAGLGERGTDQSLSDSGAIVLVGYRVRRAGRRAQYGKDRETRAGARTGSEKCGLSFHPGNAEWAVLPRRGLYN